MSTPLLTIDRQAAVLTDATSLRRSLAALSLPMMLASLGTSITNVALPTLAEVFSAPFQAVQWIVLAYLLAITALVVGVGSLGDSIGRRRLLLVGVLLFTVASALAGVAPALWLLIAARTAQGIGAAIMMALAMAFVGDIAPAARTGSAMGLLGTMSAIGTALGPSLGGGLLGAVGWRGIFLVNVPLGLLTALLVRRYLPAGPPPSTGGSYRFDHTGTLLLAATLTAYALAVTTGHGRFGRSNTALLVAAALGLALFARVESRSASPLIRLPMLRDPNLRAGLTMSALVSTVMMATLVVGPFHLARALGLGPALVGVALSIGPVVAALSGMPAGRGVDRYGAARMTTAGLTGMAGGSVLLASLPARLGPIGYLGPIALLTAGYALFQAANNTAVMAGVRADRRGVISGLLNLSRNVGLSTGAAVMGAVFARASGAIDMTTAPPDAVAAGMRITFGVATALVAAALGISMRRSQS